MKNFTKKYYIGVEGVNDVLDDIEITAKVFWKMMENAEAKRIDADDNKDDSPEYWIEKREYTEEYEKYTRYQTVFENGCCRLWLTRLVCKPGFKFTK